MPRKSKSRIGSVNMVSDIRGSLRLRLNRYSDLDALIEAGNFDEVDRRVARWKFENASEAIGDVEVDLLHCEQKATGEMIFEGIAGADLSPGTLELLLALAAKYPNLQREHQIFALGSIAETQRKLWVPYIGGDKYKRTLELGWIGDNWRTRHRFLVSS